MYETLIQHPPKGIQYVPDEKKDRGPEEYTLYGPSQSTVRLIADGAFGLFHLPRFVPVLRTYDLVHSSRGFLALGPNKYVVDFEQVGSFVGMKHHRLESPSMRRCLCRWLMSAKCAAILAHSEAARRSLSTVVPNRAVSDKTIVTYPAATPGRAPTRKEPGEKPHVLFMGEYYWKGGRELIQSCEALSKRMDFKVTYISLRVHPPSDVVRRIRASDMFRYHEGPLPRKVLLEEVYPKTDIFVMPTYIDTFGYAFVEAMACGIPCIGTRHFAVPEIIQDDATGLLVNPPLSYFGDDGLAHPELTVEEARTEDTVRQLSEAMERLLSSESLRTRMGRRALDSVASGRFSIGARNQHLLNTYEEAVAPRR